jgi:hypothetical protein
MRSVKRRALLALAVLGTVAAFAVALVPVAGAETTSGFAIGDGELNAHVAVGDHVMFWGAQWWKENDLSTDVTRPSFKGWATTVDVPKCSFTTRTGDSPPPPDGPLPEYITAVVTSKVTQSGSVINGSVTAFALIKIDPGYDGNPGHDGWGTVIGLLSCQATGSGGDL